MGCEDHGPAGVVEDSEGWSGGGWREGWDGEGDKLVSEDDVAAACALVVSFGHVAREEGAGHMGVIVARIMVSVGAWGVEGCACRVFGAWLGLRHAWNLLLGSWKLRGRFTLVSLNACEIRLEVFFDH